MQVARSPNCNITALSSRSALGPRPQHLQQSLGTADVPAFNMARDLRSRRKAAARSRSRTAACGQVRSPAALQHVQAPSRAVAVAGHHRRKQLSSGGLHRLPNTGCWSAACMRSIPRPRIVPPGSTRHRSCGLVTCCCIPFSNCARCPGSTSYPQAAHNLRRHPAPADTCAQPHLHTTASWTQICPPLSRHVPGAAPSVPCTCGGSGRGSAGDRYVPDCSQALDCLTPDCSLHHGHGKGWWYMPGFSTTPHCTLVA